MLNCIRYGRKRCLNWALDRSPNSITEGNWNTFCFHFLLKKVNYKELWFWFVVPPRVQLPQTLRVLPGVHVSCKAHGSPPIKVTWLNGSTPLNSSSDSQVTYIVQPEDKGGVFTCLAANAAGNDSADTVVIIASEWTYYKVFYTLLKYF